MSIDRGIISTSTLQSKMGFNPKVEEAKQKKEKDEYGIENVKYSKNITDMVVAGILTIKEARKLLKIKGNI